MLKATNDDYHIEHEENKNKGGGCYKFINISRRCFE